MKVYMSQKKHMRTTFNEGLSQALADKHQTSGAAQLKHLMSRGKQRTDYRQIDAAQGKLRSGGVSVNTTIDEDGQRKDVSDKRQMEAVIMEENKKKFSQTNNSPFMTDPLLHDFGYLGATTSTAEVLAGTYTPSPQTDPYAKLLLQQLEQTESAKQAQKTATWLDTETWQQPWKRGTREFTSSGPSPLHFGTFIAGA